jgi:membrane protein
MLDWITRRVWPVLRSTWNGWWKHDGNLLSAATAYYAAFSLFPLCLVLIAGLGFVSRYSTFLQAQQRDLVDVVANNVNPWLAGQLEEILAGVQARALLGGPLGLLFLILAAIGIFMQLENIFNRIWGVPEPTARSWQAAIRLALWDRLLAFLMLLAIGALLVTLFLADVIVAGVRPLVVHLPAGRLAWRVVQSLLSVGADALLLGTIYKVLPKARVGWKQAFGGGLLAAVVWAVGQYVLLSLFVGEQYSAYGVIGVMIAVMFWFYYASAAVFLGAEFVRASSEDGDACAQRRETKP